MAGGTMGGCGKQAGRPRVGRTKDQSARRRSSAHTREQNARGYMKEPCSYLKTFFLLPTEKQQNMRQETTN